MGRRFVARSRDVEIDAQLGCNDAKRVEALGGQIDPPLPRRAGDEEHRLRLDEGDQLVVEAIVELRHAGVSISKATKATRTLLPRKWEKEATVNSPAPGRRHSPASRRVHRLRSGSQHRARPYPA